MAEEVGGPCTFYQSQDVAHLATCAVVLTKGTTKAPAASIGDNDAELISQTLGQIREVLRCGPGAVDKEYHRTLSELTVPNACSVM
jgi:hypothetical protein